MNLNVEEIFLGVLDAITSAVATLLGFLPNPDPFPAILDELTLSTSDSIVVAYQWLNTFTYADVILESLSIWFLMFPLAWVIMWLWKWLKAR